MQFKQTLLALALAVASSSALAANVTTMSVTSGTFSLGTYGSGNPNPWTNTISNIIGTSDQTFGSEFTFFGNPVYLFNATGGSSNTYAPYACGVNATCGTGATNGPAVNGGDSGSITANVSGSTITADLSGWTAFWNGTNFNQGATPVTGTYNSTTGAYSLSWTAMVVGGPFSGQTGAWSISGTAMTAPVPEASTYGMMVVGLGLVGAAVMRRRKI